MAVIHALMVREMKTRFGDYRLGYAWAVLEPLLQVLFFSLMYAFGNRTLVGGLAIPVFLATGIAPFLYFQKVVSKCQGAVSANQNLFLFRQVRVFDAFLVRFLLEMATNFVVLILLIGGAAWLGFDVQLVNSLTFFASLPAVKLALFRSWADMWSHQRALSGSRQNHPYAAAPVIVYFRYLFLP